jgi:hypothetical protein
VNHPGRSPRRNRAICEGDRSDIVIVDSQSDVRRSAEWGSGSGSDGPRHDRGGLREVRKLFLRHAVDLHHIQEGLADRPVGPVRGWPRWIRQLPR